MKFPAWYALVVGVVMIGWWGFVLATGQVPELRTEPIAIGLHLVAEIATAVALIGSGWATLAKRRRSRGMLLAALGMLLYTVVVSPGYFAERGNWPPVVMFSVLAVLTVAALRAALIPAVSD